MTVGGSTAWEGTVYHFCDYAGTEGLSVGEWNMNITYAVDIEGAPVSPGATLMTLSTPRLYLPSESKIESGDRWTFSYNLSYTDTTGSGIAVSIPVSGSYQDEGLTEVEVDGTTMEAWHISSDYTMSLTADPTLGVLFSHDYDAEAHYYWVEDMGLVKETHVDTRTDAVILAKDLTDYSGL